MSNLAEQFRGIWDKRITPAYQAKGESEMKENARQLVWMVINGMKGFFHVTGNTINSVAVGIYRDGNLVYMATSREELGKGPTRKTLKKGEFYDLNYYWGNSQPFNRKITRPYQGETGERNYYGHEEAVKFLRAHKPSRSRGLAAIIVVAVDYAKYIETVKMASVLTETRNALAGEGVDVSVIKCGG